MRSAEERVWIQTPYVVLDGAMRDGLRAAAEQAPEMVLLTNSRAGGNNIVASADAVFHRGMALSMPLAYYELQAPRSMHTKAMLVDGDISVFGSFNFDMRSAYSDTEVMLAVKSEPLNDRMAAYMLDMRALALPVEAGRRLWRGAKRRRWTRRSEKSADCDGVAADFAGAVPGMRREAGGNAGRERPGAGAGRGAAGSRRKGEKHEATLRMHGLGTQGGPGGQPARYVPRAGGAGLLAAHAVARKEPPS